MQCANPECRQVAQDLQQGTLLLLEMDVPPDERIIRSDSGFPVCTVPSRYFWLCPECSSLWIMKRWTPTGLVLEANHRTENQRTQTFQSFFDKIRYQPAGESLQPHPQASVQKIA